MGEKRKLERFKLSIPTTVLIASRANENEAYEMSTKNICAGGAFFETKHPIPEGTKVLLSFILPIEYVGRLLGVSSYLKLEGTVVRVEMEGLAVSFNDNYKLMPFRNV
jgi:hypothetical protein